MPLLPTSSSAVTERRLWNISVIRLRSHEITRDSPMQEKEKDEKDAPQLQIDLNGTFHALYSSNSTPLNKYSFQDALETHRASRTMTFVSISAQCNGEATEQDTDYVDKHGEGLDTTLILVSHVSFVPVHHPTCLRRQVCSPRFVPHSSRHALGLQPNPNEQSPALLHMNLLTPNQLVVPN